MSKRIIIISDTHNKHLELNGYLPPDDGNTIIIHSGDLTMGGKQSEINDFLIWFSSLPYTHKIFIAGNHDFGFEIYDDIDERFKQMGVIYLMDSLVDVDGIRIYGSPWQPYFHNWAFNLQRGEEINRKWKLIPEGIDLLITHGPPFGILDKTHTNYNAGCEDLYIRVFQIRPEIHCFGHIHMSYGYREIDGITFINASTLGEDYKVINQPIIVTLNDDKKVIDITRSEYDESNTK